MLRTRIVMQIAINIIIYFCGLCRVIVKPHKTLENKSTILAVNKGQGLSSHIFSPRQDR